MKSSLRSMLFTAGLTLNVISASAIYDSVSDTAVAEAKKAYLLRVTGRLHSLGVFGYGGMIANENPAIDVNVTYTRKLWTIMVTKALDLYDWHSPYDYTLVVASASIHPSSRLIVSPVVGMVIGQREEIIDNDSDGMLVLLTTYKFHDQFSIEHCARFSNTFFHQQYFDWVNRFRLLYTKQHFDASASLWHNNDLFDNAKHTSMGLSLGYGRIPVSKSVLLGSALTGIVMTNSTDEDQRSACSGLALTISATFEQR